MKETVRAPRTKIDDSGQFIIYFVRSILFYKYAYDTSWFNCDSVFLFWNLVYILTYESMISFESAWSMFFIWALSKFVQYVLIFVLKQFPLEKKISFHFKFSTISIQRKFAINSSNTYFLEIKQRKCTLNASCLCEWSWIQ